MQKSNLISVHVFLHLGTFCFKLSELEQFENWAANCQFVNKTEFSGKLLHPMAKCKKGDPP